MCEFYRGELTKWGFPSGNGLGRSCGHSESEMPRGRGAGRFQGLHLRWSPGAVHPEQHVQTFRGTQMGSGCGLPGRPEVLTSALLLSSTPAVTLVPSSRGRCEPLSACLYQVCPSPDSPEASGQHPPVYPAGSRPLQGLLVSFALVRLPQLPCGLGQAS